MTKTVKVTFDMPEVPGYEYTGEYRQCMAGETYMGDGKPHTGSTISDWPVLRKVPSWRPARVEDAIRALQGIRIEARFWDSSLHSEEKTHGILVSFVPVSDYPWIKAVNLRCAGFRFCEVKE